MAAKFFSGGGLYLRFIFSFEDYFNYKICIIIYISCERSKFSVKKKKIFKICLNLCIFKL
jgi:hypothetical protein